ncbi:MAG TPA: hypothetical protein VGP92_06015, partial [Acidimicrobiia bacterium]|nr:hypothetical protein [Acidimicrobiia bacterium]
MKSRRFLFVAFVAVLIAAALAAGRASDASSHAAGANAAGRPTVVAQSNAVWFCPGLPPALPERSARVTFSNVGNAPADVEVTDLADKGNATHLTFQVPVNAVVTKARSQLGGPGALTVETFGGRVLVEEGIE